MKANPAELRRITPPRWLRRWIDRALRRACSTNRASRACKGEPDRRSPATPERASDGAAARDDPEEHDDDGDHQQRVNEVSAGVHGHAASPAEEENEDDDHENEV